MKKRKITAEDLLKLKFIRSVTVSPDESKVMFTVETVDDDKKGYSSHIYMVNIDGSGLRQFTFGKVSDSNPAFSPDGKWILFTSKRGEKKGLYKMSADGGEPSLLNSDDGSFSELSIAPDGKKILAVFKNADDVPKDDKGKKEPPVYRHINRMFYKLDNAGFMPKDPGHIYTVDMETGEKTKLTKGKNGERGPIWLGKGDKIAYISNIQHDPDMETMMDDIFVMPSRGGKAKKLATPAGPVDIISGSPDGKWIAYVGHDEPRDSWGAAVSRLWKVPVSVGKAIDLAPKIDRMAMDLTISDTAESHEVARPTWSDDGRWIYFMLSENGSTRLYKTKSSGGKPVCVIGGKLHIAGASISGKKKLIATIISTSTAPAEIFVSSDTGRSKPKRVTWLNDELIKELDIQRPEELIIRGDDNYPIHTWILKPPGFNPNRKYPSILEIHGGPRVQYGHTFFHEMQLLAAKGYVVYYSNPRGGQGYGRKHAEYIENAWGTYDYKDCMSVANHMAGMKYINKNKMGVTGGSYGGYMTNWIVTHTNFFKAAVTQRSVVNMVSFYGSSDLGFDLDREIYGSPWKNLDSWWEMSPIKHVANVRTPLLIIHSEQDLRCPMEQAEQLYISLKKLKRKVEFVRFPGEPHGLSRCGRPDRRLARLGWIVKWFDRYLKR